MRANRDRCPDDLVARSRRGPLSLVERRALDAHLSLCGLCRGAMLLASLSDDLSDETGADADARIARLAARVAYGRKSRRRAFSRTLAFAFGTVVLAMAGVSAAWVMVRRAQPLRRVEAVTVSASPPAPLVAARIGHRHAGVPVPVAPPPPAPAPPAPRFAPAPRPRLAAPPAEAPRPAAPAAPATQSPPAALEPTAPPPLEPLAGGDLDVGTAAARSPDGPAEVFAEANAARRARALRDAVARYHELQRRFPDSDEARLSFFSAGDVLMRLGEPAEALAEFDRYLDVLPSGALASEALFGRARCLDALGRAGEGLEAWQRLLHDFPRSIYESVARRRLAELGR